jgi:hypothetical protein
MYTILAAWIVVAIPSTLAWSATNLSFHPGENEGLDDWPFTPLLILVPILLLPLTGVVHLAYIEATR